MGRGQVPALSLSAWLRYDAVQRLFPHGASRVLEIGAGLGSVGLLLARQFEYVGLEPDPVSFETAAQRIGPAGIVLDLSAEEYESGQPFEVVCAFEVLEHCEDDVAALAGWTRHLKRDGCILLSVPYGRRHFGPWDRRAGHFRRYDREDLVVTMERAGLSSVETVAYGFPLGSALSFVRDQVARHDMQRGSMEQRTLRSARQLQPPPWAAQATRVASAPFRLVQRPFAATRLGPGIVARGRLAATPTARPAS